MKLQKSDAERLSRKPLSLREKGWVRAEFSEHRNSLTQTLSPTDGGEGAFRIASEPILRRHE
jgi:hypothetical protein